MQKYGDENDATKKAMEESAKEKERTKPAENERSELAKLNERLDALISQLRKETKIAEEKAQAEAKAKKETESKEEYNLKKTAQMDDKISKTSSYEFEPKDDANNIAKDELKKETEEKHLKEENKDLRRQLEKKTQKPVIGQVTTKMMENCTGNGNKLAIQESNSQSEA